MRVSCSRCQTSYEVPETKLGPGAVKVRCSQCGHMFLVRKRSGKPEEEPQPGAEARFEDFDFSAFEGPEPAAPAAAAPEPPPAARPEPPPAEAPEPARAAEPPPEFDVPDLGELDLGDFENFEDDLVLDDGFGGGAGESLATSLPEDESLSGERLAQPEPEPVERVRDEDLIGTKPTADVQVQGLADDLPHLDIQRGPRRSESVAGQAMVARDRRRSPLFWIVLVAGLGTAAFTAYNLYRHPEAFTFLQPSKLRTIWQGRQAAVSWAQEELKGYYYPALDEPAERRFFVVEGRVRNKAQTAQSLVRVRVNLFGADGQTVATREAFCGNLLSRAELSALPTDTIEARLQNEVGKALSNLDIAPGGHVPFMVAFPEPPAGVEKYNVAVIAARSGS